MSPFCLLEMLLPTIPLITLLVTDDFESFPPVGDDPPPPPHTSLCFSCWCLWVLLTYWKCSPHYQFKVSRCGLSKLLVALTGYPVPGDVRVSKRSLHRDRLPPWPLLHRHHRLPPQMPGRLLLSQCHRLTNPLLLPGLLPREKQHDPELPPRVQGRGSPGDSLQPFPLLRYVSARLLRQLDGSVDVRGVPRWVLLPGRHRWRHRQPLSNRVVLPWGVLWAHALPHRHVWKREWLVGFSAWGHVWKWFQCMGTCRWFQCMGTWNWFQCMGTCRWFQCMGTWKWFQCMGMYRWFQCMGTCKWFQFLGTWKWFQCMGTCRWC